MRTVYRISKCKYIDDLSGNGAYLYAGRWHNKGTYILYTASASSLALLENVVHLDKLATVDFCMISLSIPTDSLIKLGVDELPDGWDAYPAPSRLARIGDRFIRDGKYLALEVPSAVMPEDTTVLLNPRHPAFSKIKILRRRNIAIDSRLRQ